MKISKTEPKSGRFISISIDKRGKFWADTWKWDDGKLKVWCNGTRRFSSEDAFDLLGSGYYTEVMYITDIEDLGDFLTIPGLKRFYL